jgi:hypothetical protein
MLANADQILVLQAQQIQMQEGLFGSDGTHSLSSAKNIYSINIILLNFMFTCKN